MGRSGDHRAHCYADDVKMITGCTFGKGIIRKSGIGTLGFTLTDRAIGRLVRISCQETLTEKA